MAIDQNDLRIETAIGSRASHEHSLRFLVFQALGPYTHKTHTAKDAQETHESCKYR